MGEITIYLDSETEKKIDNIIETKGISKSRWILGLIQDKTAATWPDNIIQLAGAWSDVPSSEEIRRYMGADAERESL